MGLVQRQIASLEALKRLGFEDEDIHVETENGKIFTVLKTQGKTFKIGFPDEPDPKSVEDYQAAWMAEARRYGSDMPESERNRIYREHWDADKLDGLNDALIEKGFAVPSNA